MSDIIDSIIGFVTNPFGIFDSSSKKGRMMSLGNAPVPVNYPIFLQTDANGNISTFDFETQNFKALKISGDITSNGNLNVTGNSNVSGNLTVSGNINGNVNGNVNGACSRIDCTDTRSVNSPPSYYANRKGLTIEFKVSSIIGLPADAPTYVGLETTSYYPDNSPYLPMKQTAVNGKKIWNRFAMPQDVNWGAWTSMSEIIQLGRWKIDASDDHLRFKFDDQQKYVMHNPSNSEGFWSEPNGGYLKFNKLHEAIRGMSVHLQSQNIVGAGNHGALSL